MTTPRYATTGCSAVSQVHGIASSSPDASNPTDYAWVVSFNNGNSNYINRNNNAWVRAVRGPASEYQGAQEITLKALHNAWQRARRKKQPSQNQVAFESRWIDGLLQIQSELNAGTWKPRPTMCFVAQRPKAREIHAPDFGDRIVHHWLVPQLEAIYEPKFIHDSYANRKGKGSHAAVDRLRDHVRSVHSGQGGGWFLQLDVHNFFNSISRPTLYRLLKKQMVRHRLSETVQRVTHALLNRSAARLGVIHCSTPAERELVPAHKRLENAPRGCGIPIGNLSSQFFANVYLNELDQFVKHELKAGRYVRYVDDFVLVHHDRAQLEEWLERIKTFLAERLQLRLKSDIRLRPLSAGIDFLGYVVFPTHTRVRRRVVSHARSALSAWRTGRLDRREIHATPAAINKLTSIWTSYQGHFRHANSHRLRASMKRSFPALVSLAERKIRFDYRLQNKMIRIPR